MDLKKLTLKLLPERLAVCRLDSDAALPSWIDESGFYSITRTNEELSVVCSEERIPPDARSEAGWRCFKVEQPLDFSEIGIIFSITQPLAENGVSIFIISTFITDYFLVKEKDLAKAIDVLTAAGHQARTEDR
jgi:hypothetical protein